MPLFVFLLLLVPGVLARLGLHHFEGRPRRRRMILDHRRRTPGAAAGHIPLMKSLGSTIQARPVDLGRLSGASAHAIRKLAATVVLIVLIDDSISMYSYGSGDMHHERGAGALSLVQLMRTSGGGSVFVGRWGSAMGAVTGELDVKKDFREVRKALGPSPALGGTNPIAALNWARRITAHLPEDKQVICITVSDGLFSTGAELSAALGALPPDSAHLLLVDRGNACTPQMESALQTAGFHTVVRLTTFDTLANRFGAIYAQALGLELNQKHDPKGRAS